MKFLLTVYVLLAVIPAAAPLLSLAQTLPNDECDSAIVISALPYSIMQNTRLATPNPGDPILACADSGGGKTVWFRYAADQTRFITFTTRGSEPVDYDIAMAIYTGTCDSLVEVACNDDIEPGVIRQSEIRIQVQAGNSYIIHIAEWNGGGPGGGVPTGGDLLFRVCVDICPPLSLPIFKGPRTGSVPSGVIVTTDAFTMVPTVREPGFKEIPHPLGPAPFPAPTNVLPPKGPEGSNYIEDKGLSSLSVTASRPVVLQSFQGIPDLGIVIPPDPIMAVGPEHILACVNQRFRIWDKNGTILKTINSNAWFASALSGSSPFDPSVIYDHFAKRWIMLWDNVRQNDGHFLVSVSDDSIPLGTWYNWALPAHTVGDSATPYWADYPHVGYDDSAIYVTSRQFPLAGGGFAYSSVRIIPKAQLYTNTAGGITWSDLWDLRDPDNNSVAPDGVMPTITYGSPGVSFLVNDSPFRPGTYFTIRKITNPLSNPSMTAVNIPVVAYSSAPNAGQLGGGSLPIEGGGSRIRAKAIYRDSSLWTVHSVASGPGNMYSAVRYARFNPFTNTNLEDISMGLTGFWHFYNAIMVDQNKNVVITFSRSGTSEFAGAYLSGRKDTDPTGLSPSFVLKAGEANYVKDFGSGRNRWGDYNGIGLDPTDGTSIWTFTEYAASPANTWGTWVGKVKMGPFTGASISTDSMSIRYGRYEVGTASDTVTVSIINNGTDTLTVSSIALLTSDFLNVNLPTLPLRLATFETANFGVVFIPQAGGNLTDTIIISSSDTLNPTVNIALAGRGVVIGAAQAGVMYAASTTPSSQLYSINTSTGAATPIGSLGINEIHGLAIRPTTKELYGTTTSPSSTNLYRVSAGQGDALLATIVPHGNMRAIAFSSGDTLYGGTTTGKLYRINPITGDTVFVGQAPGVAYSGLSFSPTSGVLWASVRGFLGRDRIYTVNTNNGDTTFVGRTGDNQETPSIAFDPLGSLFGIKGSGVQTNNLISIDTLNAVGTLIGSTGVSGLLAITMRTDSIVVSVRERQAVQIPKSYALNQNYPNPFNPITQINYALPVQSKVTLTIFNLLSQEVMTLVEAEQNAGSYEAEWNGTNNFGTPVTSGLYFYRLEAQGSDGRTFREVKKMLLLK